MGGHRLCQAGALLYLRRRLLSLQFQGHRQCRLVPHFGAGYPTFTLEIDSPGFAYGYADYGSGNVSLPGQYVRSRDDGACWNNPETSTKICAW